MMKPYVNVLMRLVLPSAAGLVFLMTILAPSETQAQDAKPEDVARQNAEAWLALVDEGKYEESWNEAAPLFRQAVTAEQWAQAVRQVYDQVGALSSRTFAEAEYSTSLPNTPPGEYVLIEYASTFALMDRAVEAVVMMKTEEGAWRPVGYFVRPATE